MNTIRMRIALRLGIMLGMGALLVGCSGGYEEYTLCRQATPRRARRILSSFVVTIATAWRVLSCRSAEEPNQAMVELGGKVTNLRTYDDLVTAIINPSHRLAKGYAPELVSKDGKSRMTVYNDVMTVSQLIDLVTFLQGRYELVTPESTRYPMCYGP